MSHDTAAVRQETDLPKDVLDVIGRRLSSLDDQVFDTLGELDSTVRES